MHIKVQVQLLHLLGGFFFPHLFLPSNYLDPRLQKSFVRLFKIVLWNQANDFHRTVSRWRNGIILAREFGLLLQPKIVQYHRIALVRFPSHLILTVRLDWPTCSNLSVHDRCTFIFGVSERYAKPLPACHTNSTWLWSSWDIKSTVETECSRCQGPTSCERLQIMLIM